MAGMILCRAAISNHAGEVVEVILLPALVTILALITILAGWSKTNHT
jgi:hypothetical protein